MGTPSETGARRVDMFEIASRTALRVQTSRGNLGTEELWKMPLTVLDEAYKDLSRQIRESESESLLAKKDSGVAEASLKRDLVKYIVETRQAENAEAHNRAVRKAQAGRVRELLAQKKDAALAEKSEAELAALLEELEG